MPGAKGSVIIDRFFSNSCQTNAMQENLREETRDFNKNSRQVQQKRFLNSHKLRKKGRIYQYALLSLINFFRLQYIYRE